MPIRKISLTVSRITVLLTDSTDKVSLYTTLPSTYPAAVSTDPLCLDFSCAKDTAVEYLKKVFDVEPDKIINTRSAPMRFSKVR